MKKESINILIVDDEEVLLESIRRRLHLRGFNVIAANRGDKALEAAAVHPLDIAVIDLKMPGMGGKELLTRLKKNYPWLEVIVFTGHGAFDPQNEADYGNAFTHLFKPCSIQTILATIVAAYKNTVMNRHQITTEEMATRLKGIDETSIWDVLNKLKEIDSTWL